MTGPGSIDVYPDRADPREFRWSKVAGNGETTADSGEGYSTLTAGLIAAKRERGDEPIPIRVLRADGSVALVIDPEPEPEGS